MTKNASSCLDEDQIQSFVAGTLEPDGVRVVLEHVDRCATCAALVSTLVRDDDVREERGLAPRTGVAVEEDVIDGRYRLVGTLGRGATGTVYRAHDEKLGVDVALKRLRAGGTGGDQGARAFARELKVGRRVTHPNVCRLHDAGTFDGDAYITMELVEGETLADLLARETPSAERAVEVLRGVASGLAAVHAQKIVHRDLKPANVMIEAESGRPILTDFGFAADLESDSSRRLVGTPSFWAPEQARGESPTTASDVYSFGLVAYRLLTGREYSLSDPSAIARVPRAWRAFVQTCLEPRPSERFPDAAAMCAAMGRGGSRRVALGVVAGGLVLASIAVVSSGPGAGATPPPPPPSPVTSAAAPAPSTIAARPEPPAASSSAIDPVPPGSASAKAEVDFGATKPRVEHPPSSRPPASRPSRPAPPPEDDPLVRH